MAAKQYQISGRQADLAEATVPHTLNADGTVSPVGATAPQPTKGLTPVVIAATPAVSTSAYSAGQLLFDWTALAGAVLANNDGCLVDSITLIDADAQAAAIDLYVASASTTSMGTVGGTPSITAAQLLANGARLLGQVGTGGWTTIKSGLKQATLSALALEMQTVGATSLWIAGIVQSTPTYTNAAHLTLQVGIIR